MYRPLKVVALLIALLLVALPALAQDADIPLVPHTDEASGIEAAVPEDWNALGNGIFARQSGPTDPTLIAVQSAPLNADSLLTALLPQLMLTEAPEPVTTHEALLTWTLYQVDVNALGTSIHVDLALAESGGTTYLLLLQTSPEDQPALLENVFMPILEVYQPLEAETADEDLPYTSEEVTFESGDVTISGTLTLPEGDGPFAAAVLVTGSGPQDRDGTLGGGINIKPQALLADGLTRAGIAVLRYDERGVGQSTGDYALATVPDFAADAEAAISYLHSREDINPDQVGLIGHSEGGMVASIIGGRNEEVDFIIALAAPGVSGGEVLLLQNQLILAADGTSQDDIDAQIAFLNEMFTLLDDPEALEAAAYEVLMREIENLSEEELAELGDPEEHARMVAQQTAQQFTSEWFQSFLTYGPAEDWAQTTVPVLAIFGGKDLQVDAEQNAPAIEAALAEGGNEDFEIVLLPDANHLLQSAETGALSEYTELPNELTPDLLPTIIDWLADRVDLAK